MGIANGGIKVGSITGTGAAITTIIGFVPDYIKLINITDADRYDEWITGMAAGTAISTVAAVATLATEGFTMYDGVLGQGFTIGTTLSENAKVLKYIAMREM